jgi:hypothetical protein
MADYEFSGPFFYLKHHLSNFLQLALFDAKEAENVFSWPFDTVKYRYIDFSKVVLKDVQKADLS